jgi:hypothetical protein
MVTSMTDEDRRLLAELFREDDRLRAEHEDWMARMRETGPGGILYRTNENNAQERTPAAVADVSDADGGGALFGDRRDDHLAQSLGVIIAEMRAERAAERNADSAERNAAVAKLKSEVDELRGKLDVVVTLLGADKAKSAAHMLHDDSVVELPNFLLRRTHPNAA